MSTTGQQAGGIVGFLNALRALVDWTQPSAVIVAWEGGGSARRRALFPGYKADRRPPRLNRYYEDDIPDSHENRMHQVRVLVDAIGHLPIRQLFIEDCEADDVIGYLCRNSYRDHRKVIASSDRDYYQLLDDLTMLYTWSGRRFVGPSEATAETGIAPCNFALAKAVVGDRSDNVPGIRGVGFKTLVKRIPRLGLPMELTVQDLIEECSSAPAKGPRMYSSIMAGIEMVKLNLRLMHLDTTNLAAVQVGRIEASVGSSVPSRNKMGLMRLLLEEGLASYDVLDLFSSLAAL